MSEDTVKYAVYVVIIDIDDFDHWHVDVWESDGSDVWP